MSTGDAAHVARAPLDAYDDASSDDVRFVDAASGKRLSGSAFVRLVGAARRALVASAATVKTAKGEGDDGGVVVVALGCDVGVEFVAYFLAACALGWTPAPLNSRWSASEAREACASVSATMVVLDASHVARWDTSSSSSSSSSVFEGVEVLDASALWEEEARGEEDDGRFGGLKRRDDGVCSFCFTSGTTGKPKAVMLTHDGVCAASRAKHEVIGYERGDTYLHCAPLFHVGGLSSAHASLAVGSKHVFMPKFDVKDALRLIDQERVTAFIAVPTMMAMMTREVKENPGAVSGTSVRRILVGAGRLMDGQFDAIRSVFPNAVVTLAYGMSETSSSVTFLRPDDPRLEGDPMFAGNAVRGVEIKTNADGELFVRGPIVMLGYHGVDRQDTFDAEGWFATGDLGKVAESENPESETGSRVWLYGRVKEIIKTGGENVAPHEVERVLNSHPDVETSAVTGVPDPTWGEIVVAFVVRKASSRSETCEAKSIVDHCVDANLARFKVPKRIVFVESIPLNSMGKVSRSELLETHAQELETSSL